MKRIFRLHGNNKMLNELKTLKESGELNVESIEMTTWKNGDPKHIFIVEKVDSSNIMYDKNIRPLNKVNRKNGYQRCSIYHTDVADEDVKSRILFLND